METETFASIDAAVGHFFNLDEMLASGDPAKLETARNWVAIHVARGVFRILAGHSTFHPATNDVTT